MNPILEYLIVGAVVLLAVFWAVRAGMRTVRKTGACSSCASSGDCPATKDPALISDLMELGNGPKGRNSAS